MTTTTLPTISDVQARIAAALEGGTEPKNLDISLLCGLSAEQIAHMEKSNQQTDGISWADQYSLQAYSELSMSHNRLLLIAGAGGRARTIVGKNLTPIIKKFGITCVLEGQFRTITPLMELEDTSTLRIFIPLGHFQENILGQAATVDTMCYEGVNYKRIDAEDLQKLAPTAAGWQHLTVDDIPIAINPAKSCIMLGMNIATTRTWSGFSASAGSQETDQKALATILKKTLPMLPHVRHNLHDEIIVPDGANQLVNLVHQWQKVEVNKEHWLLHRIQVCKNEVVAHAQTQKQARDSLQSKQRELAQKQTRFIQLKEGGGAMMLAAIDAATVALNQISGLKAVCSVEPTMQHDNPALKILFHDVSIRDTSNGCNRLIKGFYMITNFSHNGTAHFTFAKQDGTASNSRGVIHPHIMSSTHPCLGDASTLVSQAAYKKDWVMLVNVIVRWAAGCKQQGEYLRDLAKFPITDRPVGWIVDV